MFDFKKFNLYTKLKDSIDKNPAKSGLIIGLTMLFTIIGIFVGGWITNIIWIIQQDNLAFSGEVVVSIIGIPIFPIGMIHGIWLWF
jgi:hypothetical protein